MLPLLPRPNGKRQRDHEEQRREQSPRNRTAWGIRNRFQTAEVFLVGAIDVAIEANFGSRGWGIAGSDEILGNRLIFIEAYAARISADESLVENTTGQLVELVFFKSLEHARADLGRAGDFLEGNLALLAFLFQFFAKGWQPGLRCDG